MIMTLGGENEKKTTIGIDDGVLSVYTNGKDTQETMGMPSEAQKKAVEKYDALNTVQIKLKLNKRTDADVLQRLVEIGNKQGYIKRLIREDMSRSS